jgi:hypothetical protein
MQTGKVLGVVQVPAFSPRKRFQPAPAEQPVEAPVPVAEQAPAEQPVLVTA